MSETETADPVAGFAALMAGARPAPEPAAEDPAPYGYTVDKDGTERPKKAPGRPRKSPSLDDLKAAKEAAPAAADAEGDRAPAAARGRRRRRGSPEQRPAAPMPQKYRAEGAIARGINQLYRKAGKLMKAFDPDIGQALVEITRAEDEDDVTVGDAWEALCRGNPRIRAFWLRALTGGAWSQVFAAHLPVLGVIMMKDSIRRRIPFGRLVGAFLEDDEQDGAAADGTVFEGLRPEDVAQMQMMAQQLAEQVMNRGGNGAPVRGDGGA
jgi:hypothetical protein